MSFINDTFTDVDTIDLESHTGEAGATWVKHTTTSGNMRINNDGSTSAVAATVNAPVMYYASGSPATAEYDVESLGVKRIGPAAANFAFLAGRIDTTAATFYVAGFDFTTSAWIIQKRIAGTSTTLATVAGTWAENATKDLKFEIRDASKKLFADGVEVVSTTDNTITAAGKAGIRAAGSGTYALFNNFTATDATGASTNATADGGTGTVTITATGGEAAGGSSGTDIVADGGTGTITITGSGGDVSTTSTGSFVTDVMENNTGAGVLASTAIVWTWYQGSIGAAPTSTTHGTGTTNSLGVITASGLPAGAGFLLVRTNDSSGVYYQPGTVT